MLILRQLYVKYITALRETKNCCLLYPKGSIKEGCLFVSRDLLEKQRDINIYTRGIDLHIDDDLSFDQYIQKMKGQVKGVLQILLE
jgi:hypothetical protein